MDLRAIVTSMASRLRATFPPSAEHAERLAFQWAALTAERLPTAQGPLFRPEREIAGEALYDLVTGEGLTVTRDESTRLVRGAWSEFVARCGFQPDVSARWLRHLRSFVDGLGLVTDGDTEAVAGLVENLRLRGLFDAITISETVRAYKPDSRIYRAALESLDATPDLSLFVSDSPLDLSGAAAVGLATAFISRGLLPDSGKVPADALILVRLTEMEEIAKRFAMTGRFELR